MARLIGYVSCVGYVVALLIVVEFLASALAQAFDWKRSDVLSIMAICMAATALVAKAVL